MLTFGSLFAGIGGFDLGLERAGMQCKWQVEIDDYASRVLAKHWPNVHRERDIRECGSCNLERVDVICGGFPCQDISYAGLGAGLDGERSGLFFEAIRVVRELQPRVVVLENVAALLTRGLDRVLGTLAEIGYDAEWHCIPAASVGAPHIRDRVFIIGIRADSISTRTWDQSRTDCGQERERAGASEPETLRQAHGEVSAGRVEPVRQDVPNSAINGRRQRNKDGGRCSEGTGTREEYRSRDGSQTLADTKGGRCKELAECNCEPLEQRKPSRRSDALRCSDDVPDTSESRSQRRAYLGSNAREELKTFERSNREPGGCWFSESGIRRVANGIPNQVHRLRGLGNAVVPQVAEWIGRRIIEVLT